MILEMRNSVSKRKAEKEISPTGWSMEDRLAGLESKVEKLVHSIKDSNHAINVKCQILETP